ncbi:MAG: PIG-L family deacetylase [Anaerolineaceae bacterium]|nr:PIG-L family deacetylase [Anaerolineaceae bacterium]
MQESVFYQPKSALVIVAHPDDIEYSCAGTIARWVKNGARVGYVLCTSGEVGIADEGMTKEKAALIREKEQTNAAAVVGVTDVTYLREPDGMLIPSLALRKKLVREIRRFKPEVVVCGDPTVVFANEHYINHPDHRASSQAALDAVFPAAGQPNLFEELEEEGLQAYKPRKVYITGFSQNELVVNITETIDLKIQALRAHISQMVNHDPEERVREWASESAKGKEMRYAEAFRVITVENDEKWQALHPEDFE